MNVRDSLNHHVEYTIVSSEEKMVKFVKYIHSGDGGIVETRDDKMAISRIEVISGELNDIKTVVLIEVKRIDNDPHLTAQPRGGSENQYEIRLSAGSEDEQAKLAMQVNNYKGVSILETI